MGQRIKDNKRLLAALAPFAAVYQCSKGKIHLRFGQMAWHLSEKDFILLTKLCQLGYCKLKTEKLEHPMESRGVKEVSFLLS